jgi:hypothetical protein
MSRQWIILLSLVALIAGCAGQPGSATELLPSVPNTDTVEGQTITEFISKLADGAALLAANPPLIAVVEKVEGALSCYQDLGAVAMRTYTDKTFPLSAGIIAVIDGKALKDPANFLNCVVVPRPDPDALGALPTIEPCVKNYTLKKADNEFYIAYMATTKEMCEAFCSRLEGCQ